MTQYATLFEPITLKSGVSLANRLVVAPMTTMAGFENGMTTSDELAYFRARSGGVGAFITPCAYVSFEGKAFPGGLAADDDRYIPSLAKVAQAIQSQGSKAILQIFHGGRMIARPTIGALQPVSASAVPAETLPHVTPRALEEAEIERLIEQFGAAARRAVLAGFDGVEIHGANTYLIQQFFSPHANRRTDRWGGTRDNRMRFPLAVVAAVKSAVQQTADRPFAIGYRLSPEEIEQPGITLADTLALVDRLADSDLDYLHISLAHYAQGSLRDKHDTTSVLQRICERVAHRTVVIGVGQVTTPTDAQAVQQLGAPIVAIGRALLADPQWVQKVQDNHVDDIHHYFPADNEPQLLIPDAMWEFLSNRPGGLKRRNA